MARLAVFNWVYNFVQVVQNETNHPETIQLLESQHVVLFVYFLWYNRKTRLERRMFMNSLQRSRNRVTDKVRSGVEVKLTSEFTMQK